MEVYFKEKKVEGFSQEEKKEKFLHLFEKDFQLFMKQQEIKKKERKMRNCEKCGVELKNFSMGGMMGTVMVGRIEQKIHRAKAVCGSCGHVNEWEEKRE